MKIKNKIRKIFLIKLLISSFIVIFFGVLGSFILYDNYSKKIENKNLISIAQNDISMKKEIFKVYLTEILWNLEFLKITLNNHLIDKNDINEINNLWKSFSEQSKNYDQIRYLNTSGDEIIRINYNQENGAAVVENKNLQNKKDRYYFKNTINFLKDHYYFSEIDLNVENDKVEIPIKPMLRLSSPVIINDKIEGVVVSNVLIGKLISEFNKHNYDNTINSYILNSDGYWISGGSDEENWAFMFEEKKTINFSSKYPDEWKRLEGKEINFITKNGYFSFEKIYLEQLVNNKHYDKKIKSSNYYWMVSHIKPGSDYGYLFYEPFFKQIFRVLHENIIFFIGFTISLLIIIYLFTLLEKNYETIKELAQFDELTNTLNRRAGIELLEKLLKSKNKTTSVCFIDVNGLKQVNDFLGHNYGDELITTVADVIKDNIRDNDYIIRFGGDEFIIIFSEKEKSQAEKAWERIKDEFKRINETKDRKYILSVSHGIVESKASRKKMVDDMIKIADKKMYEEKRIIKKDGFSVLKNNESNNN